MKQIQPSLNWDCIDLVVFDLDGTLYDQAKLRAMMGLRLLLHAAKSGSLDTLRILSTFRQVREMLADHSYDDFTLVQFEETACVCGCSPALVKSTVSEWIERRPLAHLLSCRFAGVAELFAGLRNAGKTIAVLSDYPAQEKLSALALRADIVVSSTDEDVHCLKPNPKGLNKILDRVNISAGRALMIGDRYERDWKVADKVGMPAMLLSRREHDACRTFKSYRDAIFAPLTAEPRLERRTVEV